MSQIDISVNPQRNGMYLVTAQKLDDFGNDGAEPEEFGDAREWPTEASAIRSACNWANHLIAARQADQVTIFKGGNEHATLPLSEPLRKHTTR